MFVVSVLSLGIFKRAGKRVQTNAQSSKLLSRSQQVLVYSSELAAAMLVAASWATTVAATALQIASQNDLAMLDVRAGTTLQALQGTAAALACVYTYGIGRITCGQASYGKKTASTR